MKKRILILGNGFLGNKIARHLRGDISCRRIEVIDSLTDYENYDIIINCIGATGRPNVDWCEDHKPETYFANVHIPYLIAEFCKKNNIKMIHLSSGCIYSGDNNGRGFGEEDDPNFERSYYSHTKVVAERLLKSFNNVLQLRIRMPFDKEPSNRDLLSKLLKYEKLISENNSITIIDDLLFLLENMIEKEIEGLVNCVNPEPITAREIIEIYEEEIGHSLNKEFISLEQLETNIKAPRSNCVLRTDILRNIGLEMPKTKESIRKAIKNYIKNL